jgi:hypothetical protein
MILIKIVWKRLDSPTSIAKVLTGIVDLSEIIQDSQPHLSSGIAEIKAKTA